MSSPISYMKRKAPVDGAKSDAAKKVKTTANASITSFFKPPAKAKSTTPSSSPAGAGAGPDDSDAPPSTFNLAKWVATLTPEQKRLLHLEIQTLHPSWLAHLKDEIVTPEFLALKRFLESEVKAGRTVFPPRDDIYSWSRYTPFSSVKCVILGQDPYHNHNQAHGLAFSVRPPTRAPPSLKNMYIALRKDYPSFTAPARDGGLLTPWAERGVLLLNTCLTVRAHEANSHAGKGWERFTQRVIDLVAAKRARGVVFLAWGAPAGKRVARVDTHRHLVLKTVHPSPLSASRGFFDCGHFKACNEWLAVRYGDDAVIDWNLSPAAAVEKKEAVSPPPATEEEKADETVEGGEEDKDDEGDEDGAAGEEAKSDSK
ncbi:uracil-DNA glycosylase [Durotheca rogersii]|uniref:uracil-DNA glycosylase n=1 Tax=Durotheca rogersii TaxID=419775 RepID=UPI00221EEE7B|nr:uracil-DNA glycosylase [Durotheca rogersii]KAI5861477.1 uracil-DNA glycosylase [Durotheca rogersii]